jgi:hypothetical protein
MAHDVFICHAHEDLNTALAACAKLEAAHIRCWMAPRDVGPGAYARQLVEAISGATAVLLVYSGKANQSEHVLRELEIASSRDRVIIPFRIEDVRPNEDLEYFTLRMHWLDALTPPIEARLDELVRFVQRLLSAEPPPIREAPTPPPQSVAEPPAAQSGGASIGTWLTVCVLLVLWLLGVVLHLFGGFIHLVLIVALVLALKTAFARRRARL